MDLLFTNITNERVGDSEFVEHYAGIEFSMNTSKLLPSIKNAIYLKVLKFITLEFYEEVAALDESVAENATLVNCLKDAVAHYAIVEKLNEGGANLSELGLHYRNDDGSTQNVSQWQYFAAKYDLTKKADAFFERFLYLTYERKADFSAFAMEIDFHFITSPRQLSTYLTVENSTMLFFNLQASFRRISKQDIKRTLTDTLYNTLLVAVRDKTTLTEIQTELLDYVREYLCSAALLHAIPFLNIDLSDGKLFTVSTDDGYKKRAAARTEQVNLLIQRLQEDCKIAKEDLICFINQNLTDLGLTDNLVETEKVIASTNSVGLF